MYFHFNYDKEERIDEEMKDEEVEEAGFDKKGFLVKTTQVLSSIMVVSEDSLVTRILEVANFREFDICILKRIFKL